MRLDKFLFEKGICESRNKAVYAISHGEISVNGAVIIKNSFEVLENDSVVWNKSENFVSIGGYKLDKAFKDFSVRVDNLITCDVGASTGGFTDVLIRYGAKKVYAVDLNDELLHESLKKSPKVVPIIKNVKDLNKCDFREEIDFLTADLSFISETIALPILKDVVKPQGEMVILIKPQFELNERRKFKNGIVNDEKIIKTAVIRVVDFAKSIGLYLKGITVAPVIKGKNREYLAYFSKKPLKEFDIYSYNFE